VERRTSVATILLVDDEPSVFLSVELALEPHKVLWARNETEAREILARERPQLLVLDYLIERQPTIPGVLLRIRREWPWIPVLVLTANGSEEVAVEAFRAGADDYLSKPFDVEDLRYRVERLPSLHGQNRDEGVRVGAPEMVSVAPLRAVAKTHPALRRAIQHWLCTSPQRPALEELSRVAGVSRRHLIRLFREKTGLAPGRFFERFRIRQGIALLRSSPVSVSEIALMLGFVDSSHFSRVFRKHTGLSPQEFRQKNLSGHFPAGECPSYTVGSASDPRSMGTWRDKASASRARS
jgi:AraC-like DNA-binding protein/ActR/RegA family two-component response regulator